MSREPFEDLEELARRAVACRHWRWMPGMLTETGVRVLRRDADGYTIGYHTRAYYCVAEVARDTLPDLRDPATIGCLLALVREAWANPTMHARAIGSAWCVWSAEPGAYEYATEAAALVEALEAAP